MRKINTQDFRVATRSTSRDINRRIALNLIREHQPISRADLARRMNVTRGAVSVLVQELINQKVIYEGATGEAMRGRKPTFLHIRTQNRFAIAVDVRFSKTYVMVCDFSGRQLALEAYDTIFSMPEFIRDLANRIRRLVKTNGTNGSVEGVGVAVPVAVTVASVRPWKEPSVVMISKALSLFFLPHLRAILMAASLASAPLLQKKTRPGNASSTSRRARST